MTKRKSCQKHGKTKNSKINQVKAEPSKLKIIKLIQFINKHLGYTEDEMKFLSEKDLLGLIKDNNLTEKFFSNN